MGIEELLQKLQDLKRPSEILGRTEYFPIIDREHFGEVATLIRQFALDKGEIEALVGYEEYIKMYHRTKDELIGLTTSNGIEIKDVSIHLTTRIFGHMRHENNPKVRRGVTIEEIKETLTNKNATFYNIKKSSNGISQK